MNPQIRAWIKGSLASDPPRSRSLVITIFGDSIAPHGGAVWLGSLIDLLAPMGVNERLVRSSVFRLGKEGWIEARRHGRRSEYKLTASGSRRFEQAYRKIYARPSTAWDGEWTILFAGPGQIPARRRNRLRRELEWEGFRPLGPLMFARPAGDSEALSDILERVGVRKEFVVATARDAGPLFARPMRSLISQHWDLKSVEQKYRRFLTAFGKLANFLHNTEALEPEISFVVRTLLIHAFRRVLLYDPLLPAELLPPAWPGPEAYELCRSIYQLASPAAEEHLVTLLRREGTRASEPAAYFYQRFGGIAVPGARLDGALALAR